MYIYRVLINALSAHIIDINLNMIFYTHAEHSPIKNNIKLPGKELVYHLCQMCNAVS